MKNETKRIMLSPMEIFGRLEEFLLSRRVTADERRILVTISWPILVLWCWQRDQAEVKSTCDSLVFLTLMIGPAKVAQTLKRRDIPKKILEDVRYAIEECFPGFEQDISLLEKWDDELHPRHFAPFVQSLN